MAPKVRNNVMQRVAAVTRLPVFTGTLGSFLCGQRNDFPACHLTILSYAVLY